MSGRNRSVGKRMGAIRLVATGTLVALLCLIAACSEGVSWTPQEIRSGRHLVKSIDETTQAARLANQLPARFSPDDPDAKAIATLLRQAFTDAALVDDSVLEKLHPQLFYKFRGDYQPALHQLFTYYETGKVPAGTDPSGDLKKFMRWWQAAQPEMRWWKRDD